MVVVDLSCIDGIQWLDKCEHFRIVFKRLICRPVCLCVCVCQHCSRLGMQMRRLLSACISIGRYWQGLDRILNQGLVCELWHDSLTLMRPKVKRRPNSPQQIAFQRQSCLCHRPGNNRSENTKMRLSKSSCNLPVCQFSSSN